MLALLAALADGLVGLLDGLVNFVFGGAIEDGRDRLEAKHRRGPAQVGFENLTDVHTARHAQRVEQDVDRRSVFQERHVFFGHDAGDDALVPVTAGHLVTDRKLALGGDINLDHFQHAARQLVAALHVLHAADLFLQDGLNARPEAASRY